MSEKSVRVINWRKLEKGTLRGFFDVELPSGMVLKECSLHEKGDSRWVNAPSRKFEGKGGETKYQRLVDFSSRRIAERFRSDVLHALDALLQPANAPEPQISDEDIPF